MPIKTPPWPSISPLTRSSPASCSAGSMPARRRRRADRESCSEASGDSEDAAVSNASESSPSSSEEESESIRAPDVTERTFSSWDEFYAYLQVYQGQTHQVLRQRTSTSVKQMNDRKRKAGCADDELLPSCLSLYSVTITCTHAGNPRRRSSGQRRRQKSRSTNCPAKINACVKRVGEDYKVVITKTCTEHNHPVGAAVFAAYPKNRLQLDAKTLATVDALRQAGARKKRILQFIVENTDSNPTIRDIHNLVNKLKKQDTFSAPVDERMKRWIEEFCSEDGNVGRVFVNEKNVATCITLQTRHMRQMFKRFPEVIMVDATHGTNNLHYKLFSFMVHDAFGKGQYVQHALISNERKETLSAAVDQFKAANPDWKKTQCVIVDKDFTEIAVLSASFPQTRVLLCQFHVIKYLGEEVAKAKYMIPTWHRQRIEDTISLMVYATTELAYERHFSYLQNILSTISFDGRGVSVTGAIGTATDQGGIVTNQVGVTTEMTDEVGAVGVDSGDVESSHEHPFLRYFRRNWDVERDRWCSYQRQNVATLGNNTNNRLEASWKQIKELVNSFMHLDECAIGIMAYQTLREREYRVQLFDIAVVSHPNYDAEMTTFANMTSDHAATLTFSQYEYAMQKARYRFYKPFQDTYYIMAEREGRDSDLDEPGQEYAVDTRTWRCSCLFMVTRLLPCRHVFYIRHALVKDGRVESVIPFQHLNQRWSLKMLREDDELEDISHIAFQVVKAGRPDRDPLTQGEKFCAARETALAIANDMSTMGTTQFRKALTILERVADCFRRGTHETIFGDHSDSELVTIPTDSVMVPAESVLLPTNPVDRSSQPTDTPTDTPPFPTNSQEMRAQPVAEILQMNTQELEDIAELFDGHDGGEVESVSIAQADEENEEATPQNEEEETGRSFQLDARATRPGRPKTNARKKKDAKRRRIQLAETESTLVDAGLNVEVLGYLLDTQPTLATSGDSIRQFQQLAVPPKMKNPSAINMKKHSPRHLFEPRDLHSILPQHVVTLCMKEVVRLQNREKASTGITLDEANIAVSVGSIGIFHSRAINIMSRWHRAMAAITRIELAAAWVIKLKVIDSADPDDDVDPRLLVREDSASDCVKRLRKLPLMSDVNDFTSLRGNQQLEDTVLFSVLNGFRSQSKLKLIHPALIGAIHDESMQTMDRVASAVGGLDGFDSVVIPINFSGVHWCGIVVNLEDQLVISYDPAALYQDRLHVIIARVIKPRLPQQYRYERFSIGNTQLDNYNCGVYVLLFFEAILRNATFGPQSRSSLQRHRFRYLHSLLTSVIEVE